MTDIIKTGLIALLLSLNLAAPVAAGPLEDGRVAYQRGDYASAMAILHPLAEQGYANAQSDLGLMYSIGRGVTENKTEALYWQRLSGDQGNADAQNWLGAAYFYGWGVPLDLVESAKWYRDAADQGHAEAQYELGALYENGFGVPNDYVEAMKWSILAVSNYTASQAESRRLAAVNRDRQAAKLTPAQVAQAEKRARDWKPTPFRPLVADLSKDSAMALQRNDYPLAVRLLRPLAERGHAESQTIFGVMYLVGEGVPRNPKEAVKWFRLAAKQGEAGGQDSLGLAYEEGSGIPQDYVRAYMWYGLAAASGDPYAAKFAQDRDKVAGNLTAAQVAAAQVIAQKCKLSKFTVCD